MAGHFKIFFLVFVLGLWFVNRFDGDPSSSGGGVIKSQANLDLVDLEIPHFSGLIYPSYNSGDIIPQQAELSIRNTYQPMLWVVYLSILAVISGVSILFRKKKESDNEGKLR